MSRFVYEAFAKRQDVAEGDILIVRDGTCLVGTSAMVLEHDQPLLYCGGILKLRCHVDENHFAPLVYALLNTEFVQAQIRSKQFTRDVIDTLGQRFREIVLPVPRDEGTARAIGDRVGALLRERVALREDLDTLVESMFA